MRSTCSTRTAVVTSWNAGARAHQGLLGDEIIGQHFSRFYTERDRAAGLPARAPATSPREKGATRRKAGACARTVASSGPASSIDADPRRRRQLARLCQDHPRHHRAPRSPARPAEGADAAAPRSQKMEALGQLTGGVAHDFNNLLMVVSGHVQTLKKLVADDPRAARAAEAIELAAQRGAALTRQLLSFSRRQRRQSGRHRHLPSSLQAFRRDRSPACRQRCTAGGPCCLPQLWPVKVDVGRVRDCAGQPGGQCARRHAGGRRRHHLPPRTLRWIHPATTSPLAEAICRADGRGYRHRHPRRCAAADLRSVLHHQAGRQGHRPRPVAGATASRTSPAARVKVESELGKGTRITLYLPRATKRRCGAERHDARPKRSSRSGHGPAGRRQSRGRRAPARDCWSSSATRSTCVADAAAALLALDDERRDRPRVQRHRHAGSNGRTWHWRVRSGRNIPACRCCWPPATATRCATSAASSRSCASRTRSPSSAALCPQ